MTDLYPKFPKKSSRYRSRRPFAPGTQGIPINTPRFRRSCLGIQPVDLLHQEPEERLIYIPSSRRRRLGIEAVNLLHQETKVNQLTPQVSEEVVYVSNPSSFCTNNPRETHLHPKFPHKSSRYRSRQPFVPGTQGKPINTPSCRRSCLGIQPVDLLHQEPKGDRFTPFVSEEVV